MWYIIFGYLIVSALLAILFWLALIVAKRSDERNTLDLSEDESKDREISLASLHHDKIQK